MAYREKIREHRNPKIFNISRMQRALLMNQKAFFIAFERLSFGEKIKQQPSKP